MGDPRRDSSVRQGIANRSRLYEAAENLRKVLYLAKSSDLSRVISTSTNTAIEAAVTKEFAAQTQDDALRDLVLGQFPARIEDIKSADEEISKTALDAAKTSILGVKNVSTFTPADFYNGILTGIPTGERKQSDITHVRLTNTGQENNFSTRGAEYVAIFSNLIPSVELSKCTPYFNMKLIQNIPNDDSVPMPFLTLDTFLGAMRTGGYNTSLLRKLGNLTTIPVTPVNMPSAKLNTSISGMELFQAPQTLVTPGINTQAAYKAHRGVHVLDPMQPLASIESINFDVSALSQNFMTTNTKIDMTIILHDKSRLAELSPLITPGVFPTVQAEIEWGWSHPESGEFTNNQFAKFLNALKSKQVFCVNSATFNNRDATSLSIKLQLTGLGEWVASNTSVYTGEYVSYELVRAKMNQLFTIIDERAKDGYPAKQKFIGAYEQVVELSNWETSDKWIKYEDYYALSSLIDNVQNGMEEVDKLVSFYSKVLSGIVPSDTTTPSTYSNLSTQLRDTLRKALEPATTPSSPYAKSGSKAQGEPPKSSSSTGSKDLLNEYIQTLTNDLFNDDGDLAPPAVEVGEAAPASTTTASTSKPARIGGTITFGDAFHRLFCVPVSLTGIYDEIRVTMFDFNDHAGRMAGLNIGSFPMTTTEVSVAVVKNKMTAQKAAQELIKLVNNAAAVPYGIKKALLDKQEAENEIAKDATLDPDEASRAREQIQGSFELALQRIYEEKANAGLAVSFEPKFDTPRIKMHTEVTPVLYGDTIKQVLNVFIFDGSNSGYRGSNIITSIMQQDCGAVRIFRRGKEFEKFESGFLSTLKLPTTLTTSKKTKVDDMPIVSIDRETAKKIITLTMPTLRIGSEGSMITNASYSSSASGDLSNVNLLRGIKNSGGASAPGSFPGIDADLFLIPATLTLTMPGMPIINRGQTFYVDFGTGTTLDNTYTVTTVKHSMKLGSFTTTVTLNPTNQGSIKSVTSKLQTDLKILQQHASTKISTTSANQK